MNISRPARSLVTILTELPQLLQACSKDANIQANGPSNNFKTKNSSSLPVYVSHLYRNQKLAVLMFPFITH
jgi:hypothetical protein